MDVAEAQTKIEQLQKKIEGLEEQRLRHIEQQLEMIMSSQRDMEKQLEKYGARWGTVLMVLTGLGAAVQLLWDDIVRFFHR